MSNLPSKTDLTGAGQVASAAATIVCKLFETVRAATGTVFGPVDIVLKGKAEAYAYKKSAEAEAYKMKFFAKTQKEIAGLGNAELSESLSRTVQRLMTTELRRQENIDYIVNKAVEIIQCEKDVSDQPVNPDWTIRFINNSQDVSDEEMKNLWAQILAGEVAKPGSYSLRTLECLKNMSKEEAELFVRASSLVIQMPKRIFLYGNYEVLNESGISFEDIQRLIEIGLLNAGESTILTFKGDKIDFHLLYLDKVAICKKSSNNYVLPIISLSSVGQELYRIVEKEYNEQYFISSLKDIKRSVDSVEYSTFNFIDKDGRINYNTPTTEIVYR